MELQNPGSYMGHPSVASLGGYHYQDTGEFSFMFAYCVGVFTLGGLIEIWTRDRGKANERNMTLLVKTTASKRLFKMAVNRVD